LVLCAALRVRDRTHVTPLAACALQPLRR
jgi:hypothetical protein